MPSLLESALKLMFKTPPVETISAPLFRLIELRAVKLRVDAALDVLEMPDAMIIEPEPEASPIALKETFRPAFKMFSTSEGAIRP